MPKYLIINADDFGYDKDTYEATVELIENGAVTSATLMTGFSMTEAALEFARSRQTNVSFGLHFNIVDAHVPASVEAKSLLAPNGLFYPSNQQRLRALAGAISQDHIAEELSAQLGVLRRGGLNVSHVDSHGHLHKFPAISRAMVAPLKIAGIRKVRRPQNMPRLRLSPNMLVNEYCAFRFPGFLSTQRFGYFPNPREDWFATFCRSLEEGTTELSIHPGHVEAWRASEFRAFVDAKAISAKYGVQLMSYWELGL